MCGNYFENEQSKTADSHRGGRMQISIGEKFSDIIGTNSYYRQTEIERLYLSCGQEIDESSGWSIENKPGTSYIAEKTML